MALRAGGVAAACVLLLATQPGRAEVLLEGNAAAVRLEATQATVDEILAALGRTYNVRYRTTLALDRAITGTYSGPLAQVIARVLAGYDYVARSSPDAIEIAYVRPRGSAAPASTAMSVTRVDLPMSVGALRK
ncbi:MAG: hypothetical protein QOG38_2726 [Hyphomicrobiales bacterium]|jgi:hypothetical protein|nr:hypothetical protein [Hyphomicrobiales bacterium]